MKFHYIPKTTSLLGTPHRYVPRLQEYLSTPILCPDPVRRAIREQDSIGLYLLRMPGYAYILPVQDYEDIWDPVLPVDYTKNKAFRDGAPEI